MIKYHPKDNRCKKCNSVHESKDVFFKRTLLHPFQGILLTVCAHCGYKWKRKPLDAKD